MTVQTRGFFLGLPLLALVFLSAAATAATLPDSQRARFDSLTDKLYAPCCYAESVRVHRSQVAIDMRNEITNMMAQGMTDRQILDVYVKQYGERVLMVPEGGKRQWLFVIPVVMLALGGLVVFAVLRRLKHGQTAAVSAASNTTIEIKDSDLEW